MSLLQKNLAALQPIQPALARALALAQSREAHAQATPDGGYAIRLGLTDGPWLASRRAPLAEAERMAAAVAPKPLQPIVVLGVGTGHSVAALLERHADNRVVVLEASLPLLRLALERSDFSAAIAAKRLGFGVDLPGQPLTTVFDAYLVEIGTYGYCPVTPGWAEGDPAYSRMLAVLGAWIGQLKVALESAFAGGRVTVGNMLDNVRHYLRSQGWGPFAGSLRGMPAVLVAAGPSLARNLHVLKQFSGSVYVHAVSSALKRVLDEGVEVHSTNVVDYHHLSIRYFEGIASPPPLWAQPNAHPEVLDGYAGPLVVGDSPVLRRMFGEAVTQRADLNLQSSNVAHHAFQVLAAMGANPIILIGLDQANSFHISHAPGTAYFDEIAAAANRFGSLEMHELVWCTSKFDVTGQDVHGNPLTADPQMTESALRFESMFRSNPGVSVINATQGGRRLAGASDMALKDALGRCAKGRVNLAAYQRALAGAGKPNDAEFERGHAALERVFAQGEEFAGCLEFAEQGLLKALADVRAGGTNQGVVEALEPLNSFIEKRRELYDNVSMFAAADLFQRRKAKQAALDPALTPRQRAEAQALLEAEFVGAMKTALGFWQAAMGRSLQRLDGAERVADPAAQSAVLSSTVTPSAPARAAGTARVEATVDAFIQFSGDAAQDAAFVGDAGYSPLAIALAALTAEPSVRRVLVPWDDGRALPVAHSKIQRIAPLPPQPYARAADVRRLAGWAPTSHLRGPVMSTWLGTEGEPTQVLDALASAGGQPPDFIFVVPSSTGFLTPDVLKYQIECARVSNWEQAFYTSEGPLGLVPFLWERVTLEQVRQQSTPAHIVFHQTAAFWGRSYAHMPSWAIQCRRAFSLATRRGREFCAAVARKIAVSRGVAGTPVSLRELVDAANQCHSEWVGDLPRDLEIELTTRRAINPSWLPKLGRGPTDVSGELFRHIVEQCAVQRDSINLTLGGHGDPLERDDICELIAAARPHVNLINLRTFGQKLTLPRFTELAAAGLDALTIRLGAWGREQYQAVNGVDGFEQVAAAVIECGHAVLKSGRQTPLVVPEVIKSLTGDKTLLEFRHAWWSPATWPNVLNYQTWNGAVEPKQAIELFPRTRGVCLRITEQMQVLADGRVPLCAPDFDAKQLAGDLSKQTIRDVWRGPVFEAARGAHQRRDYAAASPACAKCNEWFRLG